MLDYKDFGDVFGLPKSIGNSDVGTLQTEQQELEDERMRTPGCVPVTPPWTSTESPSESSSSPRSPWESVSSSTYGRKPDAGETICAIGLGGSLDEEGEVQLDLGEDVHPPIKDQIALDSLPEAVGRESSTTPYTFLHQLAEDVDVITRVDSRSDKIRVSRAYRLLPVEESARVRESSPQNKKFLPRVYIQGIAEETHGLSDTLLSVLSIRCGEVIDDLFEGVEASNCGVSDVSK